MTLKRVPRRGLAVGLSLALPIIALIALPPPALADEPEPNEIEVSLGVYRQPGGPCDLNWRQEFRNAQGREARDEDCLDRVWSLRFLEARGYPPGPGDWERRFWKADPLDEDPDRPS